jgi:hypothetical protein
MLDGLGERVVLEEMKAWIDGTLIGPDLYFATTAFKSSRSLYWTSLGGSFLLSLIDGSAGPAAFRVLEGRSKYNELIRVVQRLSAAEPAC